MTARALVPVDGVAPALVVLLVALSGGRAGAAPPADADALRAACRTATETGTRAQAIHACDRVLGAGAGARDMRAAVVALMRGPEAPTTDEFFRAYLLAEAAARLEPAAPWGALAQLDVARRWGDPALVAERLAALERVAPAHPETAGARAALRPGTPWRVIVGWCVLAAAVLATLLRSLLRAQRSSPRRRAGLVGAVALALALAPGTARPAAPEPVFPIDDAQPERSVPAPAQRDAQPLDFAYYLQDLVERAAAASRRGDEEAATRYHRAMALAVPDSALGHARLCRSLEALGRRDEAIAACRDALAREGAVLDDHGRFARLILGKPELAPRDIADVRAVAEHLAAQPGTAAAGSGLACDLALRIRDDALLRACTAGLVAVAPDDARTISYQWSLAVKEGRVDDARHLVERARAAGVGEAGLDRMEEATRALQGGIVGRLRDWRIAVPLAVAAVGGLTALALRLRRRAAVSPA